MLNFIAQVSETYKGSKLRVITSNGSRRYLIVRNGSTKPSFPIFPILEDTVDSVEAS